MIFYRVVAEKQNANIEEYEQKSKEYTDDITQTYNDTVLLAIETLSENKCNLIIAIRSDVAQDYTIENIVNHLNEISGMSLSVKKCEEISMHNFNRFLRYAENRKYIDDRERIISNMKLSCECRHKEYVIEEKSREETEMLAKDLLYDGSLLPEFERIYQKTTNSKCIHHPVHYIVRSDNEDYKEIVEGLISSLYINKRLSSKRYSEIEIDEYSNFSRHELNQLYSIHQGGTIVAKIEGKSQNENNARSSDVCDELYKSLNTFNRYNQNVLTIYVMPSICEKETELLYRETSSMFVEIYPENARGDGAKKYLKYKAAKAKVTPDDGLFNGITDDKAFTAKELTEHFSKWHSNYVRTEMYPQYAQIKPKITSEIKHRHGDALKALEEMIGLQSVKKIIYNALDYYKVQKMYKQFGKQLESPSMHMVFTGNPGTAKTTVARLFAQILKDNDVITNGKLIEVGRADLVGKYVGHTAPLVRKAFNAAEGGVLFIDEAYSLLEDKNGLYGDEAINTIVQEMENRRNNTIVIFAGYPKEMDGFLLRNPGLKSRIAFHVPFDDYNPEELVEIAKIMAKNKESTLSAETQNVLLSIFERASKSEDFGNGRYVRNIMEKAEINRASRLAKLNFNEVTNDMLEEFEKSDFEIEESINTKKKCIGFIGGTI